MLKIILKLKDKELKTLETDKAEISIGRNGNNERDAAAGFAEKTIKIHR